jgi:hypothetical protein
MSFAIGFNTWETHGKHMSVKDLCATRMNFERPKYEILKRSFSDCKKVNDIILGDVLGEYILVVNFFGNL